MENSDSLWWPLKKGKAVRRRRRRSCKNWKIQIQRNFIVLVLLWSRWLKLHRVTKSSISFLYSSSCPFLMQPTMAAHFHMEELSAEAIFSKCTGWTGLERAWFPAALLCCNSPVSRTEVYCQIVCDPCHRVLLYSHHYQFVPEVHWLDNVKGAGEVQECNPYSTSCFCVLGMSLGIFVSFSSRKIPQGLSG